MEQLTEVFASVICVDLLDNIFNYCL